MAKNRKEYSCNSNRHFKQRLLRTTSKCGICGLDILTMKDATIDHILPISLGGSTLDPKNMQLAHEKCNRLKGNKGNNE